VRRSGGAVRRNAGVMGSRRRPSPDARWLIDRREGPGPAESVPVIDTLTARGARPSASRLDGHCRPAPAEVTAAAAAAVATHGAVCVADACLQRDLDAVVVRQIAKQRSSR